ncbi:MAG: glycosyltransferase [Bacteroidales bacterium]|jgi:glycosyltransferase involved in cell wall biosynthesis|nr:glycosyltransferase [Bacteroidales bacterium]
MKLPLVSVLMPCYNHEQYIVKAIKSVINCNYENIELIIIDDGSSDKSFEIAKGLLENTKKFFLPPQILKQDNVGVVRTLNRLIGLSHGEYITLLASDDMLTPNGIKDRVLYLEHNCDCDAVVGRALLINEKDKLISLDAGKRLYWADTILLKSKYIKDELILRWSIVGPCLLVRKEIYEKIGLYNENYFIEDRDFYLRILYINKLHYIDRPVAKYRIHQFNESRNKTTSRDVKMQCAMIDVRHSEKFRGVLKLFLKSRLIDLLFLRTKFIFFYWFYKIARYSVTSLYLLILKISV